MTKASTWLKGKCETMDYAAKALRKVRAYAQDKNIESQKAIEAFCKPLGVKSSLLINRILENPVIALKV